MKRKLFTLFVAALALVCLVLPMTVGAADGDFALSITTPKDALKVGDTFEISIELTSNPGVYGIDFDLTYPSTVELATTKIPDPEADDPATAPMVEVADVSYSEVFEFGFPVPPAAKNPCRVSYAYPQPKNMTDTGTLIVFKFIVKEEACGLDIGEFKITDLRTTKASGAEETPAAPAPVSMTGAVGKGVLENVTLADDTVVYDGTEKKIEVEGLPSVAKVAYTYDGESLSGVTKAGVYKVEAQITSDCYEDKTLTATLTITPVELTLTAVDKTKAGTFTPAVCGGDDVTLNGDKVAIALDAEDGKWYATGFELAGADKDNYTLVNADAKIEVAVDEATDVVTVTIVRDVEGTPETLEMLKFFKGSTAVINAPAVEGYHFAKWGDGKTDNPLVIKNIVGDAEGKMTLVAFYNKIQYINITVMQKLGDNDATVVKGPFKHEKNTAYTVTAEKVVNKDFVFKQWEYENGDKISTDEKIDILPVQDTTLVAVYDEDTNAAAIAIIIAANNKKKVTISFDTMGAAKIPAQELKKGELATMPATPKKNGYVFAGWYVESTYKTRFDFTQPVEESATLTAKWVGVSRALIMTIDSKVASAFGKTVENDVAPIIVKNRTMLPARFVAENLGAKVEWNAAKRQATITGNGVTIVLTIDSTTATVNGKAVTLDSPAFIQNDRTYTPVRFIAEALGAQVEWNATTRQAVIIK